MTKPRTPRASISLALALTLITNSSVGDGFTVVRTADGVRLTGHASSRPRDCPICGDEFFAVTARRQFCSDRCRSVHKRRLDTTPVEREAS